MSLSGYLGAAVGTQSISAYSLQPMQDQCLITIQLSYTKNWKITLETSFYSLDPKCHKGHVFGDVGATGTLGLMEGN